MFRSVGTLNAARWAGWKSTPARPGSGSRRARQARGRSDTAPHARNFLDCVRSRQRCHCDIETGHRDTSAALIGNIAHKLKGYLEWDAKTERFTNIEAANRLLSYTYRKPYRLPT